MAALILLRAIFKQLGGTRFEIYKVITTFVFDALFLTSYSLPRTCLQTWSWVRTIPYSILINHFYFRDGLLFANTDSCTFFWKYDFGDILYHKYFIFLQVLWHLWLPFCHTLYFHKRSKWLKNIGNHFSWNVRDFIQHKLNSWSTASSLSQFFAKKVEIFTPTGI